MVLQKFFLLLEIRDTLLFVIVLDRRESSRALDWMDAGAHECLYLPLDLRGVQVVLGGVTRSISKTYHLHQPWYRRIPVLTASPRLGVVALVVAALGFFALVWTGKHFFSKAEKPVQAAKLPLSFRLPYPNPTGTGTRISWELNQAASVQVEVLTVAGRRVWSRRLGDQAAGRSGLNWPGTDAKGRRLPAGVYLVRVLTGNEVLGSKTVVLGR